MVLTGKYINSNYCLHSFVKFIHFIWYTAAQLGLGIPFVLIIKACTILG